MPTTRDRINVKGQNRILDSLPRGDQQRLLSLVAKTELGEREVLYRRDEIIRQVYFPLSGMISMVLSMENGFSIEVGTIGNEGMVGTPLFLGSETSSAYVFSQVSGEALRMDAEAFREEIGRTPAFARSVGRYTQAIMDQISQSTACNQLHSVDKRLCRWLLMTHDRVGQDQFRLTQEFIAKMLGVRRPTVTVVAGLLQRERLIAYTRGNITILDRQGLEAVSCECYEAVRRNLERLLCGNGLRRTKSSGRVPRS